jgi:hypothetical protein
MRKSGLAALLLLGAPSLLQHQPATAAELITPPAMYPPDTWEGRSAAIVRVLDKLDAHVETLTILAGQSASYKNLSIAVRGCLQHPPGLPPDSAAFLTIKDGRINARPFTDWMYSAEPFIGVFESPVFGVQLVSCGGADVAPAAPPLLPPPTSVPNAANPNPAPDSAVPQPDSGPNPIYPSGTPDAGAPADGPAPPPGD